MTLNSIQSGKTTVKTTKNCKKWLLMLFRVENNVLKIYQNPPLKKLLNWGEKGVLIEMNNHLPYSKTTVVVVAHIYPPVTGQHQTPTYWTIRTLLITTTERLLRDWRNPQLLRSFR